MAAPLFDSENNLPEETVVDDKAVDYKKILKTALLAGELMIVSGAEIYRVEDTMYHILEYAVPATHTEFALPTVISLSLWIDGGVITLTQRVRERETSLNRIYLINNISRELCEGKIDIDEAYNRLAEVRTARQYSRLRHFLSVVGICIFFTLLLGGGYREGLLAAGVGCVLALTLLAAEKLGFNEFCRNIIGTFFVVILANLLSRLLPFDLAQDVLIIGAIMPIVPGVTFTTAIRDTLNGDYTSGMSRMLEAVVTAIAIASGAGFAMWLLGVLL